MRGHTRMMYSWTLEALNEKKGNEKDMVLLQWGNHGGNKRKKTILWTEDNIEGTVLERNRVTLAWEYLFKSFKKEFIKKYCMISMNASDNILLSTICLLSTYKSSSKINCINNIASENKILYCWSLDSCASESCFI